MRNHWHIAMLASLAVLGGVAGARADDAAPIRAFDIPTIEKLGQAMYAQDQEAWKATDILRAQANGDTSQTPHGWIVVTRPGGDVVRFVRDGANGPEIECDVVFAPGGSACTPPQDRTLAGAELAQYNARLLALGNIDRRCARSYNTVVLKDPERDGWLAWAMAATEDPDLIVIGGHYRFTVSADGKTIRQKDALSRGCLTLPKLKDKEETLAGVDIGHLVSLTPIETYVFDSLSYRIAMYVGTTDGIAWKVDGAHIAPVADDAPGADGFGARVLAGYAEHCKTILSKPVDGTPRYFIGGDLQVIPATEKSAKLVADAPDGATVTSVLCGRSTIVPSPNDYKVLLGGYTLYILDTGTGHLQREGVLEIKNGQLSFSLSKGEPLTPELAVKVNARLNAMQTAMQEAH